MKNLAAIFAVVVFVCTCASVPEDEMVRRTGMMSAAVAERIERPVESYLSANRLILGQVALSLPVGWTFQRSESGAKSRVIFNFQDNHESVFGSIELAAFDYPISLPKFAAYYSQDILKDHKDKLVSRTAIDNREAYVIAAKTKKTNLDVLVALIAEEKGAGIVEMLSWGGRLLANMDSTDKILGSYSSVENAVSARTIKDGPEFYCYNGKWRWYDDFNGGFYIIGSIGDEKCLVGIWEADVGSTAELYQNQPDFSIPLFDAQFFVNNRKVPTQGTGFRHGSSHALHLYYIVEHDGRHYCIYIGVDDETELLEPENLHRQTAIVDVFRFYLSF